MTREEALEICAEPNDLALIKAYCYHKGKSEESVIKLIHYLQDFDIMLTKMLAKEAYENLSMEFNFMEVRTKEGNLIRIY